jgi:hypothetical protein
MGDFGEGFGAPRFTVSGAKVANLCTQKNPHAALNHYHSFMTETSDLREAVEEAAAQVKAEIDAAVDRARDRWGKSSMSNIA